jgi:hypothetical protein
VATNGTAAWSIIVLSNLYLFEIAGIYLIFSWISLVLFGLFVRIGPFQWVTSNPNKKLLGAFGVPLTRIGYGPLRLGKAADDQVPRGRKSAEVVTGITAAGKNSPSGEQTARLE